MQSMFTGEAEHLRRLDELWERNEKAKARFTKSMEKRAAEKLRKKGWRFGKPPNTADQPKEPKEPEAPAPVVAAPATAPWDVWEMLPTKPNEVQP